MGGRHRRNPQRYPQQCVIIRLLLLTGARKREIESLCWSYLDGSFAHLPEAKTGPRTIYLGRPARDLLATISRGDRDFVFPDARKDGHAEVDYNIWARIRVAAGLDDVRLHDLRHTFGSHAAMNGVSQPTIAMVRLHKPCQVHGTRLFLILAIADFGECKASRHFLALRTQSPCETAASYALTQPTGERCEPMHSANAGRKPCQSPAMPNGRCRMHGGPSPGAAKGNRNVWMWIGVEAESRDVAS
jgi:hypothetical protein